MHRLPLWKAKAMPDRELGGTLLRIARAAIGAEFGLPGKGIGDHEALDRPGATFVTLLSDGELRGCIGSLMPRRPLRRDVRANAVAAAFRDPRFSPLMAAEFETTSIEVSLLSTSAPVSCVDEEHLLAQLNPGVDGVIIGYGRRRATFLPQVWEALAEPRQFVAALKRKAGLPADFWSARLNVSRYSVTKWKETEFLSVQA
jgi:AmmeMemoRadiSam system protein A